MLKNFIYEEYGMGTIEIAVIIAALLALVIVFRKQLFTLWNSATKGLDKSKQIETPEAENAGEGNGFQFDVN